MKRLISLGTVRSSQILTLASEADWFTFSPSQIPAGDETVSYNFEPTSSSSNSDVDVTWTLAETCQKMKFRYRCVANWNKDGALSSPNGGTCRIAGAATTSPVFRVVVE